MNAQVWIGGEVGFTSNHTNGSDHTAMELTIAPDINYSLSGNFSVAVALSYGHTSNMPEDRFLASRQKPRRRIGFIQDEEK